MMKSKFSAEPSVVTELTELSLSVLLLLAMGLFLGSFALRQADQAVMQNLPGHGRTPALWQLEHNIVTAR